MSRAARLITRVFVTSLALFAGASCGGDPSAVVAPAATDSLPGLGGGGTSTLLACDPPATALTTTGVIGALGGTLSLGGTSVVIPANAVLAPTSFQLTVPASRLVEISVRAGDAEHYVFLKPVLVTIDYGRCASSVSLLTPLSVWHIDERSKALLENMLGVNAPLAHTITFATGHLSGYAVAD